MSKANGVMSHLGTENVPIHQIGHRDSSRRGRGMTDDEIELALERKAIEVEHWETRRLHGRRSIITGRRSRNEKERTKMTDEQMVGREAMIERADAVKPGVRNA